MMARIKLYCVGGMLMVLSSCENVLNSNYLTDKSIESAKESMFQIENAQSINDFQKILANFEAVLTENDSDDPSFEEICDNIDSFRTTTSNYNLKQKKNAAHKFLSSIADTENKNAHTVSNTSKKLEYELKSKKENSNDFYKKIFPSANCIFGFEIFDQKNKIITGPLLLEKQMKTVELNGNNGGHLVVGPLLTCIAIVAHSINRAVVIHQRTEDSNQKNILKILSDKFGQEEFQILCYYNKDADNLQQEWIETLSSLNKKLKITIKYNQLKPTDLSRYEHLPPFERLRRMVEIGSYIKSAEIARNARLEPDLYLVVYFENGKIKFSNTSMLYGNYLGLKLGNNQEENYKTIEAFYHGLVYAKKQLKK